MQVGRGRDPALGIGAGGTPYTVWRMIQSSGDNLIGKLYFSKKDVSGWSVPLEIYSTTAREFAVGSPALATDDNGIANIVWKARETVTGNSRADIVFVGYLNTAVSSPQFDYEPIDTVWRGAVPPDSNQASPSIDLGLDGLPHIVWEKQGEIFYAAKGQSGWPDSFQNISETTPKESRNPHIDMQGDWVRVVWEEQHSPSTNYYDIVAWGTWSGLELTSNTRTTIASNCLEPVMDGNFIVWSEKVGEDYEIFVSPFDCETYTWGDSVNISGYPLAGSRCPQVLTPVIRSYEKPLIYCYWTEGPGPFWTRFQKREFENPDKEPYYAQDLGLETASPLTIERDGYISYGASPYQSVDFDTDTLKYHCSMSPGFSYTLELTYYHEGNCTRTYELFIDATPVDTSVVPSQQKVTVEEGVPSAAVQDGQITVEIRPLSGDTVTCGEFLLFRYSDAFGGGQSASQRAPRLPTEAMLSPVHPDPCAGEPVFEYFLPKESVATVQVFDVCGRLVQAIAAGTQAQGWHRIVLGNDVQVSGTYFCRLSTCGSSITRKFILIR